MSQQTPAAPNPSYAAAWGRRWLRRLGPLLALLGVFLLFCLIGPPSFFTLGNIETIARQSTIVGTAALGATLIIIVGGIDLSVGSVIALSTVAIAAVLQSGPDIVRLVQSVLGIDITGFVPLIAAAAGVAVGCACGAFNGLLVTRLRLLPFIVTLGSLLIFRGLAKGMASEQKIDAPVTWLNNLVATLPPGQRWQIVPAGVWMMLLLALAMGVLLRYTRFGRHVFAIGSNEQTARLCGVHVRRVKLTVYLLGAGFAGLAGLVQFSRLTAGDPTVAQGLELDVIAAVVIGGGSLAGGEGSILGSLIGALIMQVIRSGCSQMGLRNWHQEIVTGSIIILAVALDQLRRARETAAQDRV